MLNFVFALLFLLSTLQVDFLRENLSVAIAISPYGLFIRLYMIILTFYLLFISMPLYKKLAHKKLGKTLLIMGVICMIMGMVFTYHKDSHDLASSLHLDLTLTSVIVYFAFDILYLSELFLTDVKKAARLRYVLVTGIMMIMIVMLTFGAINGLGEFLALCTLLLFNKMART
jgi:hypothetical protein